METRFSLRTDLVKKVICNCLAFISSCTKNENTTEPVATSTKPLYELTLDYPAKTEPGTLTLIKATLNGDLSYPVTFNWFTSGEMYPQTLLQVDTLTSGIKAWYSFMYPAFYTASPYNKGPYYVRCAIKSIQPDHMNIIVEKTVKIDLLK